ncbi:hypothetical protein GGS21DRAFT_139499 [Xylaria nigripes]|nr:hypothetical protein GGS21DRAFT_139499 [Xylaria nigripes]
MSTGQKLSRVSAQPQEQPKTSSPKSLAFPSIASVQDGTEVPAPRWASPPSSPLSSASTIDDWELSSPILPALQAPQLPSRASGYLRTPSPASSETEEGHYVITSWGSPYPESDSHHLRRLSFSSGTSDESPLYQLAIDTPFLRPAPSVSDPQPIFVQPSSSISSSAAALANRARRPLKSISEEWIRQHTTNELGSEPGHWLSDGTDDSEHSSLSGSVTSDQASWLEEANPRTPRPARHAIRRSGSTLRHSRDRASNETLRQEPVGNRASDMADIMDSMGLDKRTTLDASSVHTLESSSDATTRPATPLRYNQAGVNGMLHGTSADSARPVTPAKVIKSTLSQTPRLKKKVPWRGKNILVLLPRDDERGQHGKPPMPLDTASIQSMLRSWEQLGYNTRGFDLCAYEPEGGSGMSSHSRDEWPAVADIEEERLSRRYNVLLPDLNAWKEYVNELAEAKLRALGVTFAEEEPAPRPSESPGPSSMSRQASNQLQSFPFSPPLPTSSATSNGPPGFPFQPPFFQPGLSASQSPGTQAVPSPVSFNASGAMKYNSRASISISPHELQFLPPQPSPLGWSPHMLLQPQHHGRNGSPSALNMMSPGSPFSPDGMSSPMGIHQRHQSLQYPMMPHQYIPRQDSARASPGLEEVREDEEEEEIQTNPYDQSPAKTPEPAQFIQHNPSNSLQKEIDEAEYHLEEQFRSQLEHEDYSPHNEVESLHADMPVENFAAVEALHSSGPSVHFSGIRTDSDEGPKLHHPQPHSRGHSLSQNPYYDNDEVRESADEGNIRKPQSGVVDLAKAENSYEVETNPSDLGTPAQTYDSLTQGHGASLSTASNPWAESESFTAGNLHTRQGSHQSKPSFSKLNASAAEFKFNPNSNFTPGQFVFGGTNPQAQSFTPGSFQNSTSGQAVPSIVSSHFSVPSNASSSMDKINPAAPVFSPQKSDFSFSSSGPKFNPDAKAFQPIRASGVETQSNKSIFGNINLSSPEHSKLAQQSTAVHVLPRSAPGSPSPGDKSAAIDSKSSNQEFISRDANRNKKQFRNDDNGDGDDVPRFAEPTPEPLHLLSKTDTELSPSKTQVTKDDEPHATGIPVDIPDDEDETGNAGNAADVTLASTVVSESTDGKVPSECNETNDTKATTSPSVTSPDPDRVHWRSIEFITESDIPDFKSGRPLVEPQLASNEPEKPQFSANATSSVPGGFMFGSPEIVDTPFNPEFITKPEQLEPLQESEDDGAGSPTPGPDIPVVTDNEVKEASQGQSVSAKSAPPRKSGLMASRFASSPSASSGSTEDVEISNAISPSVSEGLSIAPINQPKEASDTLHNYESLPVSPPSDASTLPRNLGAHELTFEEIDAVMKQINENDPTRGVKKLLESSKWRRSDVVQNIGGKSMADALSVHLPPPESVRGESSSPSPKTYQSLPQEHVHPKPSTELEDPFVDGTHSAPSQFTDGPVRRLNTRENIPQSDWDDAFSASEKGKFEHRIHYFDGHVSSLLGNLLASRLGPLESKLSSIQHVLRKHPQRTPSSGRGRRSISAEFQESDADDEDEEIPQRRSLSPRKDRRLEQIRIAVMEGMSQHQMARAHPSTELNITAEGDQFKAESAFTKALDDMKLQIANVMSNLRPEDLRTIVEQAVNNRTPLSPPSNVEDGSETNTKLSTIQSTIQSLEERLRAGELRFDTERSRFQEMEEKLRVSEANVESEIATRRAAEDRMVDLRRQLEQADTKVEVEILNRSIFDQRIHDLEERLKTQEGNGKLELSFRREAEDRLSEVQRLLRISSSEEDRLRAGIAERDQKIKGFEQSSGKMSMHITLLETTQANAEQTHAELRSRLNVADSELRDARQEAHLWRFEAEQARNAATQQTDSFIRSSNENKHLHKLIDTLTVQLEENERIRDNWRAKFVSLQDDMAHAAREITEENSRRSKKEQALIARQEVLDARLQAEARTRERLEIEVERLESGERAGMRAVAECKRLEALLTQVRNDNHHLHLQVLGAQREAQEARDVATIEKQNAQYEIEASKASLADQLRQAQSELEEAKNSAAAEVQHARLEIQEVKDSAEIELNRARQEVSEAKSLADVETQKISESVAIELESARDQANIVKADSEEEVAKLKAELDQVRLDADTANARHDMMLEESQTTKETELQAIKIAKAAELEAMCHKHQNELEDLQARYERQISNVTEDAQRSEQNLLERLSLSASKTEHLQDRVAHLEERLQIAQEAAKAAAQAATKSAKVVAIPETSTHAGPAGQTKQLAEAMQLPEKISPQALRESILVLQEQLQAREQRIEELEQKVEELDPDAATKISKRDDEIMWLRELLAVRHGDLQDIIGALSADKFNREAVKDAAIRLKANLQMEEQERERAMNGGSSLNLPHIAATISKAATPRVAQAVGPLAAAWGNWRKTNQYARNFSGMMSSPAPARNTTPSKSNSAGSHKNQSGLMTPPTSEVRATSQADSSPQQPTAFGSTGRRYTAEQFANRSQGASITARQAEKMPLVSTPPPPRQERKGPQTPPIMQSASYDNDALMEEFDDAAFFDD